MQGIFVPNRYFALEICCGLLMVNISYKLIVSMQI